MDENRGNEELEKVNDDKLDQSSIISSSKTPSSTGNLDEIKKQELYELGENLKYLGIENRETILSELKLYNKLAIEESTKEIRGLIKGVESKEKKLEENIEIFRKKTISDEETLKEKLEEKIESSKLTVIETLGIFIALFTFISVDFQVFRSYRDPWAISGLMLILLGAIGLLMSIFDFFILKDHTIVKDYTTEEGEEKKSKISKKRFRTFLFILELGLIIAGIILFSHSKIEDFEEKVAEIKTEVKNDISDYTNKTQENFYKKDDLRQFIKESENSQTILNCLKSVGYFSNKCFEN